MSITKDIMSITKDIMSITKDIMSTVLKHVIRHQSN